MAPSPPADAAAAHAARRLLGVLFIIGALACFATLDTTTQWVSAIVPAALALWVRYLFQTVVTGVALAGRLSGRWLRPQRPALQFVRGLLLLACSLLVFHGLRVMPVGEFTAIAMLTPLVVTLVAARALGEPVSLLRWLCVGGGFAGTMLVIRPGGEVFQWAMLLPLMLVGANAAYQIITSRLARTADAPVMHFYTGAVGLTLCSLALPWSWQPLAASTWLLLLLMGLLATSGHYLLATAYARAPVAVLTPYLYLQVGFAALGGWIVFAHVPDGWSLAGIALTTACGAYGTWLTARESRAVPAA